MSDVVALAPLDELEARLGVAFRDRALLERALTHRSYVAENGGRHNERLEFLGDAVLGLVVTDLIFREHPSADEGRLARIRSVAVSAVSLAAVARSIGLGAFLRLGKGERATGGADKDSILADALEAVFGATYLDGGQAAAEDLIARLFTEVLDELGGPQAALEYKTSLQELVAAEYETVPEYGVEDEGPDHAKTFTAWVAVDGHRVGEGTGRTKKEAEQAAAREAYRLLVADDDQEA